MPYIFGETYPEIDSVGLLNHRFRVLIELKEDKDFRSFLHFILELYTLNVYLSHIPEFKTKNK